MKQPGALRLGGVLAGGVVWLLTACTIGLDEIEIDPYRETRPSAFVSRLKGEIAGVRGAYHDMIVRATPQELRRLPSIDSELSRLADAAAGLADDLSWQRSRFAEHLGRAESVATSIGQRLAGARVRRDVADRWQNVLTALAEVRRLYSQLGQERLYQEDAERRGATRFPLTTPEAYDASFQVGQVTRGYDAVVKAWRDAPARRAGGPWPTELDRELAALGDPVSALGKANATQRAAVAPAVDRVRQQVERVRPLIQDHETELPRAMLEGWTRLSGGLWHLGK